MSATELKMGTFLLVEEVPGPLVVAVEAEELLVGPGRLGRLGGVAPLLGASGDADQRGGRPPYGPGCSGLVGGPGLGDVPLELAAFRSSSFKSPETIGRLAVSPLPLRIQASGGSLRTGGSSARNTGVRRNRDTPRREL